MAIHLSAPRAMELKPRIVVFGIGGAGGNAVNNMIEAGLEGVEFVVANTDAQQLQFSKTDARVQLGANVTQGLGAGAHPEVGMSAAEESASDIAEHLDGAHMVFITAGMGGGTGTGAAPVIAKCARERGILTVGVVTKPFMFEGRHRMRLADAGIAELQRYVDTLIVIPNQNLFRIANEQTTFAEAFGMADQVLHAGVRSITDLMVLPGLINLDFADVRSVMSDMGKAMMGTGEAAGEDRAAVAAQNAIQNPLLDETSLNGARAVLINVTGGLDMTLHEIDVAANVISSEVDPDANIIFGAAFDPELQGRLRVSVVATGMDSSAGIQAMPSGAMAQARSTPPSGNIPAAPRPVEAPAQPVAASAAAAFTPAPVTAPVAAQAPAASAPRSSLFEAPQAEVREAEASAPVVETPAAPPVAPVVPESRVIGRIVDPLAEEPYQAELHTEEAPIVRPQPTPVSARPAPAIQRPSYSQPERTAERPEPASARVAPQAAPSPRLTPHQEEGRESFWRGLFPQRGKSVPQAYDDAPASAPSRATDEADRYVPGVSAAKAQPVGRSEVQAPAMESEEDLEIPSFLRRLAN